MSTTCRHLVVVLGDQLDPESSAFDGFDPGRDRVWMAEVAGEATHVWSHRARIAVFLSAMRHFRDTLQDRGRQVEYLTLDAHPYAGLAEALTASVDALAPERVVMAEPDDHRVREDLRAAGHRAGAPSICARTGISSTRWRTSNPGCRVASSRGSNTSTAICASARAFSWTQANRSADAGTSTPRTAPRTVPPPSPGFSARMRAGSPARYCLWTAVSPRSGPW